jgi:hypothetical protein
MYVYPIMWYALQLFLIRNGHLVSYCIHILLTVSRLTATVLFPVPHITSADLDTVNWEQSYHLCL